MTQEAGSLGDQRGGRRQGDQGWGQEEEQEVRVETRNWGCSGRRHTGGSVAAVSVGCSPGHLRGQGRAAGGKRAEPGDPRPVPLRVAWPQPRVLDFQGPQRGDARGSHRLSGGGRGPRPLLSVTLSTVCPARGDPQDPPASLSAWATSSCENPPPRAGPRDGRADFLWVRPSSVPGMCWTLKYVKTSPINTPGALCGQCRLEIVFPWSLRCSALALPTARPRVPGRRDGRPVPQGPPLPVGSPGPHRLPMERV